MSQARVDLQHIGDVQHLPSSFVPPVELMYCGMRAC